MKNSVAILSLASIFLCIGLIRADSSCGVNEARAPCGSICEPTCNNPYPLVCIKSCIMNGCRCKGGFYRDENTKQCVRFGRCSRSSHVVGGPKNDCGPNESRAPCGPVCEPSCDNPKPEVCITSCIVNGCRCNNGYLRNLFTGFCVPPRVCLLRN